jgi:hypothetical protein
MDNLNTLIALLDLTKEAEELTSDVENSERLRSLIVNIRRKAKEEHDKLKLDQQPIETPYQLCMIGILEECDFGRVSWANVRGLGDGLRRIHEDIDRTIKEIKANRRIM